MSKLLAACVCLLGVLGCSSHGANASAVVAGASGAARSGAAAGRGGAAGTGTLVGSASRSATSADGGSLQVGTEFSGTAGNDAGAQGMTVEPPGSDCLGGKANFDRHSASCGACGHVCAPFVLASGLDWPVGIALDASSAFWITSGNDAKVMSAPLAGGAAVTLADAQPFPASIAVDATHVYWAGYGTIFKLPKTGGMPKRLVSMQITPTAIALDAHYVYFTNRGDNDLGAVMKVPLDGGDPIMLAQLAGTDPDAIAVDVTHVYWANGANSVQRMLLSVPLAGGDPVTLVPGSGQAYAIAVDAAHVYWVAHEDTGSLFGASIKSTLGRVALDGTELTTLANGTHEPMGIAVDSLNAYWTNASTSQVVSATPGTDGSTMSVPKAGGSASMLGPLQDEPGAIAANGSTVCWTTTGKGQGDGRVKCLGVCSAGVCR